MLPVSDLDMSNFGRIDNNHFIKRDGTMVIEVLDDKTLSISIINEGPTFSLEKAKDKGVRIITIGVGTEKGGPIPLRDDKGTITSYKKDQNGETVTTKLYPEVLKSIADKTKSKYILGTSTKEVVEEIKKSLDKIEKSEFESQQIADFESQYQWFLALGFLLLLVDIFLLEKKTAWVQKLNLFNEKKHA